MNTLGKNFIACCIIELYIIYHGWNQGNIRG